MSEQIAVQDAEDRIRPSINRTPVLTSSYLNELTGKKLYFKCENFQKTGSFKARGALNAILKARSIGPVKGVVAHSGGNHGQGVAWAARQCDLPCIVATPSSAPQTKVDAMRGYGAELVITTPSMTDMADTAYRLVEQTGYTFVDPMNDYDIMSGQGTVAKEFLEEVGHLDALVVAVGGGGLASGVAAYVKQKKLDCKVFCVEPANKNLQESFEAGRSLMPHGTLLDTIADGCRPHAVGNKCFDVLLECAEHTVFSVTNDDIRKAMKLILERMKLVVEPSAAMGLAAVLKYKEELKDYENIGLVLCGGNVDLKTVVDLL
ncbi:hypothetical protein QR680_007659 [Steinernema hermaphroditum]|uniref:L-serine ammonia-lyase n=1 Tax=Steinernema hermaphroditum TaxID=289476 RepID=A0AA39M5Q5_9BILA|nr:hypothetical protein QR680_007659 [Steinernema hermaphroditum]